MDKRRMIRVNDEIMNEMNKILRADIKDPRMTAMTSVLRVETTPDLKFCKVFVSIMGDEEAKLKGMEAIESARGHIRTAIARSINLRQTPEFTFILDDSLDHGFKIGQILDDAK